PAPAAARSEAAWLGYARLPPPAAARDLAQLPAVLVLPAGAGADPVLRSAGEELARGLGSMLGHAPRDVGPAPPEGGAIVLATAAAAQRAFPGLALAAPRGDGFALAVARWRGRRLFLILGGDARGALYGVFALLRGLALGRTPAELQGLREPAAPLRWTNEWDNLDGSIERGYGGRSFFFAAGAVRPDLARAGAYARLLASLGIDGCVVNNVNANPRVLAPDFLPGLVRLAAVFRPWGVRLGLAVPFNAPQTAGGLPTFDPLDPRVAAWWRNQADLIYRAIPDFAGFLVKADAEGQPGPSTYHRSHAQAANVIARALAPHGGVLVYRAFVYKHPLDFNDLKADRAKAAYENFAALDGRFDTNVVIQIKYGPIDFQVREPVSPLIGALQRSNQALELEVAQEYTGQQRQLCYLAPLWKQVLDFDMEARGVPGMSVAAIASGRAFHRLLGGFVGVVNAGLDPTWMGSDLAQANLFAFGRLAWDPSLSPRRIAAEWARLTFGGGPKVAAVVTGLLMDSWPAYEDYTGAPLGLQTLTNILGPHYGPGPETADNNGWGQWIRAGRDAIGMDRTVATGTGFLGEYSPPIARRYTSLATCPDNLVLFFHHLAYRHRLHSGQTVIQTIYDAHYRGAAIAATFPRRWRALRGQIDPERYRAVLRELRYQAGYAVVWRDAIDDWFLRLTGIPDARGRVGHHPHRVEAEAMRLDGYRVEAVRPWYAASGGKAVACPRASGCRASFAFQGRSGRYDLAVANFDTSNGQASFSLAVAGRPVAAWKADASLPASIPNADSATRRLIAGVSLRAGDVITLTGIPNGDDNATLDYIAVLPRH
ncbi:MAG: alpha-glucuronidase family glycosyl hydrolase, partial [Terriglobales bacterium]